MAAMLVAVVDAALGATVRMPGSLTDENVLHSMGDAARRWDVEYLEDAESPVWADGIGRIGLDVAIQAYYVASSRVWKPKVVAATSRYDIWWGHTVSEATAANATASNCSQMILDLTQGNPVLQYYSTEALQAHEYGHLADWETTMNQEFPAAVQTIEALSVPHSCGMSQSAAEVALTGLPGFKPARDAALRTALNTFMSFRELNADAAGQAVADRIIGEIKAKGDQNASWPQACRK